MYIKISVEVDGSPIQTYMIKSKRSDFVYLVITSEEDIEDLLCYLNELYENDVFDNENNITPFVIAEQVSELLDVEASQVLVIVEPVEVHNG